MAELFLELLSRLVFLESKGKCSNFNVLQWGAVGCFFVPVLFQD